MILSREPQTRHGHHLQARREWTLSKHTRGQPAGDCAVCFNTPGFSCLNLRDFHKFYWRVFQKLVDPPPPTHTAMTYRSCRVTEKETIFLEVFKRITNGVSICWWNNLIGLGKPDFLKKKIPKIFKNFKFSRHFKFQFQIWPRAAGGLMWNELYTSCALITRYKENCSNPM